ncbi:MAG: hypothetical protein NVSMB17_07070 [Candidatus Dormibacteria bacterium]
MEKKFAGKNVRMGILLTLVSILMAMIAWGWTALYLAFAVSK